MNTVKIIPIFGWFLERANLLRCTWYGSLVRRKRYASKECTQDQHVLAVHRSIKTSTVTVLSNQPKCISFEPVIIEAFSVIETANSLLCKQKNNYKGSYRCFSNILWCWSGFWLRSVLYVHDKALWKTLQYLRKEASKAFVRPLKFTENKLHTLTLQSTVKGQCQLHKNNSVVFFPSVKSILQLTYGSLRNLQKDSV